MASERIAKAHWATTGVDPTRSLLDPATANPHFGNSAIRGGAYMGYNWQAGNWVFGLEGDGAAGSNIDRHSGVPGAVLPAAPGGFAVDPLFVDAGQDQTKVRLGWDASIRARLGMLVVPNVMIYGTGGGAVQNVQSTVSCSQVRFVPSPAAGPVPALPIGGGFCGSGSKSETFSTNMHGWTAGIGLEALLSQSWTGRIEYRYADYGNVNHVYFAGTTDQLASRINLLTHTVSIGLALKF
jgi:outer membrane immunogenic protein